MANIKDQGMSAEKWKRRTANASTEYQEGVQNPRSDWASQTKAAEANYEKGVQAAITRKAFGKGVTKTGTSGWQAAALEKGPSRFSQGVSVSQDKYAEGFQPYADTIKSLTLPPRGPKGDPANIQRVAAVADALHKKKLALEGK